MRDVVQKLFLYCTRLPYANNKAFVSGVVKLTIIGIVIRLVFMPFTLHGDLLYLNGFSHFLAYGGIVNIYEYAKLNDLCIGYHGICYGYPPLAYYSLGFFQYLLKPLLGNSFPFWMENILTPEIRGTLPPGIYLYLFLLKFPYLFFDFGIGFIILRLFNNYSDSLFAYKLWMLNPVAIYTSYMLGQYDILPTFFVVLSIYYLSKEKYSASVICLGVGGSLKQFPLFFLLPMLILINISILKKIRLMLLGVTPYFIFALPFLGSKLFWENTVGIGKGWLLQVEFVLIIRKILGLFNISYPDSLTYSPFVGIYFILLVYLYKRRTSIYPTANVFSLILLSVYVFAEHSLHYILWITPLLIIFVTKNRGFLKYYTLLLFSAICYQALPWATTSIYLFTPINFDLFINLPTINSWLNQMTPSFFPVHIGTFMLYFTWAIFNLVSIYLIYKIGKRLDNANLT